MKQIIGTSLLAVSLLVLATSVGHAQVTDERKLTLRATSDGSILLGENSDDSQFGPFFGGSVEYGIGNGVTLFVESGYGWTNYESVDGLKLVQVPVLGGAAYDLGQLLNLDIVQPYIGAAAGVYNLSLQQDGNTLMVSGNEQNVTSFALQGIVGVSFRINDRVAVDVRGKYNHVFSDNSKAGIESQEWSGIGIGGGISYSFSL